MSIHSYHNSHRTERTFYKMGRNGQLKAVANPGAAMFIGVELEVESPRIDPEELSDKVDALMGSTATCERDGSLTEGFEIISQPITPAAYCDGFKLDELCRLLDSNGAKSHDTRTCGLHVHVSRAALGASEQARDMVCAKILVLMDKFTDELTKFARRDWVNGRWAPKYRNFNADGEQSTKKLLEKYKPCKDSGDRYKALNLTNEATIEFRIFRGTLNPAALKATVLLCATMVEFCKTHTTPQVQACTWGDLLGSCSRPELNEYVTKRGIIARDDVSELERLLGF